MAWTDVSVALREGMPHWPGETAFMRTERPGAAVTSDLRLGSHTGTHVDAPRHFLAGGAGIDQAPPDALMGPALVVGHDGSAIEAADVAGWPLEPGGRVLVQSANTRRDWPRRPHDPAAVGFTAEAASRLAAAGQRLVGIDALSVAAAGHAAPVHERLLGAGCWILEGLDLAGVRPGPHELVCLPLRIAGGDGAPARALLRRLAGTASRPAR